MRSRAARSSRDRTVERAADPSAAPLAPARGNGGSAGADAAPECATMTRRRHRPLDVRSFALTGLFVLASIYTLRVARGLFRPIVLAALIYFLMLWPLVRVLSRLENRALAGRG